jgi:phenylpyruvate tautomerase PptA (4-oxalocrotonate tautomerase family)
MPTYVCYAHRGQLTAQHKAQIAAGIARIHSEFTGAPVAFTQCVFHELNPDDHFIGVQPASENGVWVYGHIRSKRSISTKNEILLGIRDLVRRVLNVPESAIWVYLNELNHTDMVEFGRVLPEPGNEQRWLDELPRDLRDRLGAVEQPPST